VILLRVQALGRALKLLSGHLSASGRLRLPRGLSSEGSPKENPSPTVPSIRWFTNREAYAAYVEPTRAGRRAEEAEICGALVHPGFCTFCATATTFLVSAGAMLGDNINLREGLVCERCGLGNRLRLLHKAIGEFSGGELALRDKHVYIAERITPFYVRMGERLRNLTGSECVDVGFEPGSTHTVQGIDVRHEDVCRLSFESESFDILVHADVLEHVPDYRPALAEMCRVTRRGGAMFFSVPFLHDRFEHEIRATLLPSGELVHHLPAAYHGNPLSTKGSLAFRTYGWALLDDLRNAGFDRAEVGVLPDLGLGFASSNSIYSDYMEPMIVRAIRGRAASVPGS